MESSDDESETLAQSVTNYHFVNDKDEPISFSVLPIQWCEGEKRDSINKAVFLNGIADDGIKIYKQVTAWKFDHSDEHPEVSVLTKKKNWIKLLKPRKSFEDIVRTILITVHCLHFVKKHPETLGKSLWDRLWKVFSSFEVRPCENDLLDHLSLIRAATKRDESLSKSKFLVTFLKNPIKSNVFDEQDAHAGLDAKNEFIVDDDEELDEVIGAADEDASDEEAELFDSVCAICDNGGELLCCDGRCIRSFHANVHDGEDSDCHGLGLSKAQVKAMENFVCLNCQHKRHQCFACGKLGSSDKSSGAEVFHCVSATCGYFYHPLCVAKLLHPTGEAEAEDLQKRISGGESFTCPAHKCHVCKQGENKDIKELQFAVCRRCPKAYHRKCLPRKIAFDDPDEEDDITIRAWDDLLPNRVLIYCLKHKIDEALKTPIRNHIIFPRVDENKITPMLDPLSRKKKVAVKRRDVDSEESPSEKIAFKVPKHVSSYGGIHDGSKKKEKPFSEKELDFSAKPKISDTSRKPFRDSMKKNKSSGVDKSRVSSGEEKFSSLEPFNSKGKEVTGSKVGGVTKSAPLRKKQTTIVLDADTKRRIKILMEKTTSSITLEEIVTNHKVPSTHAYSSKAVVDRTITLGKVEGFVEAIRTALQKLEGGGSVEDAKAVCGPEILDQITRWKNKLKVYLAPFLHGMRYTSFGRHFTKVDKLKEIVDKLHWYTQNGDTIVDFCCGANDFSCLMKQKLEETGKRCFFKNFDVIQPKNDFCFEKRDWMTVRRNELPKGSNLIMGLNPPFGVKAALANKFIDKALEFKPKLLILIVPPETERLDRKKLAYDLVWEDDEQLSGKSFYLPGSVDVNDNQMEQWNLKPPPLYLWSHSEWTANHKAIALKQGHISEEQKKLDVEENYNEVGFSGKDNEVQISEDMEISPIRDYHGDVNQNSSFPEQNSETRSDEIMAIDPKDHKESLPSKHDTGVDSIRHNDDSMGEVHRYRRKRSHENLEGQNKGKQSRRVAERSLVESQQSEALDIQSDRAGSADGIQHFQPGPSSTSLEHRTGLGVPLASGATRRPTGTGEYGARSSDVQFPGYSVGSFGQTAYRSEVDERMRDTDMQQILRRYGNPNSLPPPSSQLPGQDVGFGRLGSLSTPPPYRVPGLAAESCFGGLNSSAMQRYTPRLDELNHSRMNSFGSQVPLVGGSGMFDSIGSQYAPGPRPSIHPNMSGFARGPSDPSSQHNSCGWLDD